MRNAQGHILSHFAAALLLLVVGAEVVSAQDSLPMSERDSLPRSERDSLPMSERDSLPRSEQIREQNIPPVFKGVGIEERLGEKIPAELVFTDEYGAEVALGSYLGNDRPVLLNFAYHNCPMLCSIMLESFAGTLQQLELLVGSDFDVITVSFAADETPDLAARSKAKYLGRIEREEVREGAAEGWHFLTGDKENILLLANAVGFQFKWIASSREYAHPAALIFLSDDGVITRYLHGMTFQTKDVRRAVVEASKGEVGTAFDKIIMYCYRYDASANSYVIHAQSLMKIAGLLTLLLLVMGLTILWRRERRRHYNSDGVALRDRKMVRLKPADTATELLDHKTSYR